MSGLRSRAAAALLALAAALTALIALPAPASAAGESLHVEVLCVSAPLTGTTWEAQFRVLNPTAGTVFVPYGGDNFVQPIPVTRPGQPTSFPAGQWVGFAATFTHAQGSVLWVLGDDVATATESSPRCEDVVADVTIGGTPAAGNVLTMTGEQVDLAIGGYDVTYTWYRDCDGTPVQVGTGRTYTVQGADAGKRIGATITYARGPYGITTSSSCGTDALVPPVGPGLVVPPYASFPDTAVGGSTPRVIYYLNDNPVPVTLGDFTVSGPDAESFRVHDDSCESFMPVGGGCTITVVFEPVAPGDVIAQLDIDDGGGAYATLAGTGGVAPARTATPAVSGTPKVDQPLTVSSGGWSGDPTVTIDWEACTVLACEPVGTGPTFTPGTGEVGESIRAVVTATNDFGTDRVVTAAVGPVRAAEPVAGTLLPGTTTFPDTTVGGTSTATVHYVNTTTDPVPVDPSITGTGAASFAVVSDDCAPIVAPDVSCAITVDFKPVGDGTSTAVLEVGDGATAALTGRAFIPKAAPPPTPPPTPAALALGAARVDLGTVPVHKQGKIRTVTITNTGGSPLVVQSVALAGKHRKDVVLATTCPGDTLAPGASCTLTLRLRPAAAGRRTASLVVATTAGAQTVALVGKGVRGRKR